MNKLLDDSVKVANKRNQKGYMVLPMNIFFFLTHVGWDMYLVLPYKIQAPYDQGQVNILVLH